MDKTQIGLLLCVAAYFLGSIPFGLILSKMAGLGDIRTIGSGNIGATNVLRSGNKKIAALTLLLDMLKGFAAMWLVAKCLPPAFNHLNEPVPPPIGYIVGLCALLGHIFPIWLKGKGGKGVATCFGVLLGISPITFIITVANWLGMFYSKRISSLAALFAVLFVPLWLYIFNDIYGMLFGAAYSLLIAFTHRANIRRLMDGTEPLFISSSKKDSL